MDDRGSAAHTAEELSQYIEDVFQRIKLAGLKLSMNKCTFGGDRIDSLGKTISKQKVASHPDKVNLNLTNEKHRTLVTSLQRYIGFVNF